MHRLKPSLCRNEDSLPSCDTRHYYDLLFPLLFRYRKERSDMKSLEV
jgi:hypothetical protein